MRKTTTILSAVLVLAFAGRACAEENLPWHEIKTACQNFLSAKASAKEIEKMDKYLRGRVEDRVNDTRVSRDTAMRSIMLDWAAGSQSALEKKEPKAIKQACFYFIQFIEKGYQIPHQMRERLTLEKARELIAYLNDEAAKGSEVASR